MSFLPPILITIVLLTLSSCGVKGKPLPPAEPAFIGNGKTIQENESLKKKNNLEAKKKNDGNNG